MRLLSVLLVLLLGPVFASAEIHVSGVFSDHAVLQRERPFRVWGGGAAGEQVTVTLHEQKVNAVADETGEWDAWLAPESAGGPYVLTIKGDLSSHDVLVKDIMLGDVWVASGQSNMEFPLTGFGNAPLKDGDKEIAAADHPMIRFLVQHRNVGMFPQDESPDTWSVCTPQSAVKLSAVAYFFARPISEHEHVAIGVIDTTWGGTPAHAWISQGALSYANLTSTFTWGAQIAHDQQRAEKIRAMNERIDADLKAQGKPVPKRPNIPGDHWGSWGVSTLFNGMISPYTRYAIKGVIWYQGETDTDAQASHNYARVFRTLISDWRNLWGEGDFPFLFVQISSYNAGPDWPTTRDAQRRALNLRSTGMAVTLDVGTEGNVHPPDKQTVGARLAQLALGSVYHEAGTAAPLEFEAATSEPTGMRVWFTGSEGLTFHDATLGGFEVAGADRIFRPAKVEIQKVGGRSTVMASSPEVAHPRYVRYGWSAVVKSFLYNGAGMPVGTFTSELE